MLVPTWKEKPEQAFSLLLYFFCLHLWAKPIGLADADKGAPTPGDSRVQRTVDPCETGTIPHNQHPRGVWDGGGDSNSSPRPKGVRGAQASSPGGGRKPRVPSKQDKRL